MKNLVRLMRPHQYIKNGFVLIGPLFSPQWDAASWGEAAFVFLAFCAMASAVYVLNDLVDIEADRQHPSKRSRPLPSGAISIFEARLLLFVLVAISIVLSLVVNIWILLFSSSYFVLNVFYSWRLKHVVILDVFVISAGFMLRILAGTVGLDIMPSSWLLLCGFMLTLFLGFSKRRAELLLVHNLSSLNSDQRAEKALTRKVLDDYSPIMLEQFIGVTAGCTILSYGLYTVSPQTVALHGTGNLVYTLPFVAYGIFRYLFLLHQKARGSDTAKDLLSDKHLLLTCAAWLVCTVMVLS
ncbi:decaprenyl-phosphate phosphoribosyltransferase [Spongiibacter sp. KMU-158]|uniref:Decaprenyl-phosphate phosphoribosyltransferase n=1 Tax=Spongiibacter pelagi TaxID=2760804 RepID=A0A927C433_9GAMM|nr:decaprenyl-phosphate phosphoribosyltransferase [Spongiibacter pelagi]MBD2859386.1 decaprenyl-phosphate phosphoribosyltransferase [Spongiibacter pelagi]